LTSGPRDVLFCGRDGHSSLFPGGFPVARLWALS
jgi:hypothetical protein